MQPLPFSKNLFWDVDTQKIDIEKNKNFIIERVLVRGGMSDVKKIFSIYGNDKIVSAIKESKNLDKVTHNFCSSYFNIPKHLMHAPSEYY
jgi:hypothetical protein